jgi:hypothetical protein
MRLLAFLLLSVALLPARALKFQAWAEKSNQNAKLLLDVIARYSLEDAASLGITGLDERITIPAIDAAERQRYSAADEEYMLPYGSPDRSIFDGMHDLLDDQIAPERREATRAFVDPQLQQGQLTPQQVLALLQKDVVLSKALATEEVDSYTFRSPGQAVSYFDGYSRLRELRADVEKALGRKFNVQNFHDFVLSQGLLPPNPLPKAVMKDFVG